MEHPTIDGPSSEGLCLGFRRHLLARGRTLDTAQTYVEHLQPFLRWLESRGHHVFDAGTSDIEAYLVDQLARMSRSTAHVRLAALKALYVWLFESGMRRDNPSATLTVRKDRRVPRPPISSENIERLIQFCTFPEDALLIKVISSCGLRISEAIGIRTQDLYSETGRILIRGKGQKERWVAPGTALLKEIETLCLGRRGRVFEMSREQARRIMQRVAKNAGVIGFYPHQLRIAWAHRFLAATHDLQSCQVLMGHADPAQTAHYAAFDAQKVALGQMERLIGHE